MIALDINDTVVVEQQRALEAALSTNPKTQKALQRLIRGVIKEVRTQVAGSIKFKHGDPRGAAQSVRTAVYKRILGANINIYSGRKAHGATSYEPPRHPSHRGGNRRTRSGRTKQIMSYGPLDRGFILRFLNDGTDERFVNFTSNDNRKADKWNKHPNTGGRGAIAPRNFFRNTGERAMAQAADNLANLIDTELAAMLNNKQ